MLFNHFRSALRNLRRERFFSALNIFGLAAALICSAFIGLWTWDEWRHDRFFPNADRIVRVVGRIVTEKESFEQAVTSVQVGPNIMKDYPEVETYCRLDDGESLVKAGEQQFFEKHVLTADSTFFKVFDYGLQSGNAATALTEPYTVVLTEAMAKKYFGQQDPVGQSLQMNLYDNTGNGRPFRVTGVLAGAPRPSHFKFDMLVSFSSFFAVRPNYFGEEGWYESGYFTYLLLRSGSQQASLQAKMPEFFKKHLAPLWSADMRCDFDLQAISEIYLGPTRRYEIGENGDLNHLYIFGTVGLLILLVAGINYVNMATARASKRARGVGVRKALGAQRGQLAMQFLFESVFTTFIALAIAGVLGYMMQPLFKDMTGKDLALFDLPYLPIIGTVVALVLGLGAGAYPALLLSGYRPALVLKGNPDTTPGKAVGLRQSLVVAQFMISIALIVSVLVIGKQMYYIQTKNLGFNRDAVLTVRPAENPSVYNGMDAFRNELAGMNGLVLGTAVTNVLPVSGTGNSSAKTVDNTGKELKTSIYRMRIDEKYVPVMGLNMLAGRNFSREFPADWPTDTTQNYILNAAAVKAFGWETPEQAIGKPFRTHGKSGQVVGIVEDFHFNTLKHIVEPLCIHPVTNNYSTVIIRLNPERLQEATSSIEASWHQHFPGTLFDYSFLDEQLGKEYQSELRFGVLFQTFSIFSILIACLGLLGLAAFNAERRTKEISIRKVLGASVVGITGLLVQDFLKLVLVAVVIASPLAYFFMDRWLSDFAYRIDIPWWAFSAAALVACTVAVFTVGGHAVQAALANPVSSLRREG